MHVELSLSETRPGPPGDGPRGEFDSIRRWSAAAAAAAEPCLVIDSDSVIVAISPSCCALFGLDPARAVGRYLLDAVRLIDFTADRSELTDGDVDKIPPLLALSSRRLARGLMRIPTTGDGSGGTVDAVATPLCGGQRAVGSLTFLSPI